MAEALDELEPGQPIHSPDVLFPKLTDEQVADWKNRFGGSASGAQ
jgi:methionyl-tRNA synthetase